jgi:hypothetical protein
MAEVDVQQWRLLGAGAELLSGRQVTLRNEVINSSVRYGEREYGINLVWDQAADLANVSFHRAPGAGGPVTFGEHLAVRVDGGGFVRYQDREYGINLVWSQTPVFEWELTGGAFGSPVRLTSLVGLFSRLHGEHVVYGEREYGINLRWWGDLDVNANGDYPPLPVRPELRGQSFEPGQIVLTGTASEIKVFHGGTDDELDWHIYIHLDPEVRRRLLDHLLAQATSAQRAHEVAQGAYTPLTEADLERVYCEWMVVDAYDDRWDDDIWFSADLTRILLLLERTAWDVSAQAADEQGVTGASVYATDESGLCRHNARVSLQGAFVNDQAHGFQVEIHPLDSLAYALDTHSIPLSAGPENPATWPASTVTWRVAAFTNSTFHRIDDADYLKKDRTTTWYLPLPANATQPGNVVTVTATFPGFTNLARGRGGLDQLRPTDHDHYQAYGLAAESHAIERDFRTGEQRLRVTVTMHRPDKWGGMFLGDYNVQVRPEVIGK